jgi:hypothetical protein
MRSVLTVNTQSIAIGSGFASLLLAPTKAVPSVEAGEISRQFGQFCKQQQQRSVNRSISMSMGAAPVPGIETQMAPEMIHNLHPDDRASAQLVAADRLAAHPIDDHLAMEIDPMATIVPASRHLVPANKHLELRG